MPQYAANTLGQCYNVLPRKQGEGGYGMGVAPHAGYNGDSTVTGIKVPLPPTTLCQMGSGSLKQLRTADPVEYQWRTNPTPWTSTYSNTQRVSKTADTQKRASLAHAIDDNIKPTYTSGYMHSEGSTKDHLGKASRLDPPEAYNPERLRMMKAKTPVEFYDLVRQDGPMKQTTSKNFQMLGAYPNDSKFFFATKTAASLM
mmetsp:Transcript_34684/g.58272  ORF Transcript_34684/g.58272 Transcript_34684/m.58272 type:complete len:200 (+) Transcript_34684:190-789(+)|eukprot:CAMPEP_0198197544 /NCGR_PEP_ID=MMETSP1445-20131203/1125_1 /TAXON_ID=36898 /ORGANISM="Pyramimonas sp., Strain CCMP2087" /LENGTH=199 /DNA_ID=CAMNT_0043866857 /DNA_START=189 /DNA_END=788 /DNA_ORIENTATION=+